MNYIKDLACLKIIRKVSNVWTLKGIQWVGLVKLKSSVYFEYIKECKELALTGLA